MDAPPDRDTEILRCVLDSDVRAAGTLLVRGYADEVYALCSSMVRDRTVAEDLSQEVFTRAFTALPRFRGDASVRTWILRIARNRCIDHLRAQNRAPAHIEEEPDAQPASEPSIADLIMHREDVATGLDALSETGRGARTGMPPRRALPARNTTCALWAALGAGGHAPGGIAARGTGRRCGIPVRARGLLSAAGEPRTHGRGARLSDLCYGRRHVRRLRRRALGRRALGSGRDTPRLDPAHPRELPPHAQRARPAAAQ